MIKRDKRGYVPYDYEQAYDRSIEDMHDWFISQMLKKRKKVIYALKEISAGSQLEIEIYPQFRTMDDVPKVEVRRDNRAQKKLNDRNSRKYVERLINTNFSSQDIWLTLTYDVNHLPPDGDIDHAMRDMQNYIARINYARRKRNLPNCKYIYVTEYDQAAEIRWHHHMIMDGSLPMDTVESLWRLGHRNQVRRLDRNENGLTGMANYIVKEKKRLKSEKRWKSSKGLIKPGERIVYHKKPTPAAGYRKIGTYVDQMVRDRETIARQMKNWYPEYLYTDSAVFYNEYNHMFYIRAKMRKRE